MISPTIHDIRRLPPGLDWNIDPSGLWLPPKQEIVLDCSTAHSALAGRVLRGVFSPAQLNPRWWYEGLAYAYTDTAGTTPVTSTTDVVALWKNRGSIGATGDLSQATLGARPGVASPLSPFKLSTDGTDDGVTTGLIDVLGSKTMWYLYRFRAAPLSTYMVTSIFRTASTYSTIYFAPGATGQIAVLCDGVGAANAPMVGTAPISHDTAWHIVLVEYDATVGSSVDDPARYRVTRDGVNLSLSSAPFTVRQNTGLSWVGRDSDGFATPHDIMSIGMTPRTLTSTERTQATSYFLGLAA